MKTNIKRYIGGALAIVCCSGVIFAQGTGSPAPSAGESQTAIISNIISLIQAVWMIPALLVGKLLTNSLATGQSFGFDNILFGFWRISLNIAYFILGFLFVWTILKSLRDKNGTKDLKTLIPNLALASIAAPISYFAILALLDIATLLSFAVATVSGELVAQMPHSEARKIAHTQVTYDLSKLPATTAVQINSDGSNVIQLDDLLKYNGDSLGAAFIYLGDHIIRISALNLSDSSDINVSSRSDIAPITWMNIIICVLFLIPILILLVISIIRLFWIWIWLAFSPILVVAEIMKFNPLGDGKKKDAAYSIGNIIGLIFQPVFMIAAMSLGVILISSITALMRKEPDPEKLATIAKNTNLSQNGYSSDITDVVITTDQSKGTRGGFIGNLFLSFLAIAIVWTLIKVASTSNQISKGVGDSITKFTEQMAAATPIPIPGVGSVAAGSLANVDSIARTNLLKDKSTDAASKVFEQYFGDNKQDISGSAITEIKSGGTIKDKLARLRNAAKGREVHYSSATNFKNALEYLRDTSLRQAFLNVPELKEVITDKTSFSEAMGQEKVRKLIDALIDQSISDDTSLMDSTLSNLQGFFGKVKSGTYGNQFATNIIKYDANPKKIG